MNEMIEDEKLYRFCKSNALDSIEPFMLDRIGEQWLELMKISTS
jgi:N-acetylgalactosamine-N,N'-diacetylbacillosaminyl-diphospho-undecaprenol 4-alpha-N-acetylgalactosaminyltransferase